MRMAITGSKQVQGFNIQKHAEYKHGKQLLGNQDEMDPSEVQEGDPVDENAETQPEGNAQ